jgi:DNA-binding LacI/PurR family transcriptional regulator
MVTMNDIAARVGVSQATVSYVLNARNNGISIRKETRERILETAAEMGYRRNDLARAMVTGKNFVFGFLTRDPSAEGTTRMMVGAQEEAEKHGYLIKLLPILKDADYRLCIERSIEQRLAGMLVQNIGPQMFEYLHAETSRFRIPVAMIDDPPPQNWGTRVISDDEGGLKLAIEHLKQLGHQHIGFVAAQANSPLSVARAELFRDLMRRAEFVLPEEYVIWTDWQEPEVIESCVHEFLTTARPRPTALICAGDMIAMSTLRAARALGIALPRELSVVGFADLRMATFADPPLTTIAQPFEEIGRAAVRALLTGDATCEADEVITREPVAVATRLVIRASTAPPSN